MRGGQWHIQFQFSEEAGYVIAVSAGSNWMFFVALTSQEVTRQEVRQKDGCKEVKEADCNLTLY